MSRLETDPSALGADEFDLGWIGRDRESLEVAQLRDHLRRSNGLAGLETVTPDEVARAARLFHRDGFVVVTDALAPTQLRDLHDACLREIRQILALDRGRVGNRGSHRYSFGSSSRSRHLLHLPEWAALIDLATVTPILCEIFEADDYHLRGGGGDFCLPGAVEYQPLHADIGERRRFTTRGGRTVELGSFHDPTGKVRLNDLPVPAVTCNFLTVDFTRLNGPTRQIPGTQTSREPIPSLDDEPEWMRLSTVCPAPAGSVLIRDVRAWHGGTPNLSDHVRAIPNAEYHAPWYREQPRYALPKSMWAGLSDHGRRISRGMVVLDDDGVEFGYRGDLGR